MFTDINILAVIVVAILAVAIGNIWYSPLLFGIAWVRALGKSEHEFSFTRAELVIIVFRTLIINTLFFGVISWLLTHDSLNSPATIASVLLATTVTYSANVAIWEKRSLLYVFIHVGYAAIILFGGAYVIAYWPW